MKVSITMADKNSLKTRTMESVTFAICREGKAPQILAISEAARIVIFDQGKIWLMRKSRLRDL